MDWETLWWRKRWDWRKIVTSHPGCAKAAGRSLFRCLLCFLFSDLNWHSRGGLLQMKEQHPRKWCSTNLLRLISCLEENSSHRTTAALKFYQKPKTRQCFNFSVSHRYIQACRVFITYYCPSTKGVDKQVSRTFIIMQHYFQVSWFIPMSPSNKEGIICQDSSWSTHPASGTLLCSS